MTLIKSYNYNLTKFITSTIDIKYLSIDSGIEIAFAGRSNVGKSSVINALTNKRNLARTSKTPGQTKFINLFEVEPGIRLVDLPGYGYAAVNNKLKYKLQHVLENYLQMRNSFKGLVLIIDIRHTIKNIDKQIIKWTIDNNFPLLILLNKSDKLPLMACNKQLITIRKITLTCMGNVQVELFSSLKKYGIDKLQQKLNYWFTTFSS